MTSDEKKNSPPRCSTPATQENMVIPNISVTPWLVVLHPKRILSVIPWRKRAPRKLYPWMSPRGLTTESKLYKLQSLDTNILYSVTPWLDHGAQVIIMNSSY